MSEGKKGRIADWILASSAAVSLGALPFVSSFAGALVFHTALAATVGGIADWYAVTSLFRRPLGISFRTELIPRSREKIIAMARDMVTREILTVPRLYRVLKEHSLGAAFLSWLLAHREKVALLLTEAAGRMLEAADKKALAGLLTGEIRSTAGRQPWALLFREVLLAFSAYEGRVDFCRVLRQGAQAFLREGLTEEEILGLYRRAWAVYEAGSLTRAMLPGLLRSQLGLTDDKAAALIQEKLADWAQELEDPRSGVSRAAAEKYQALLDRLEKDPALQARCQAAVMEALSSWLGGKGMEQVTGLLEEASPKAARMLAEALLDRLIHFLESDEGRRRMDRWILRQVVDYLPQIHEEIGASVTRTLEAYSGRDMARLIEEGVWEDLQMIRVNGSVIGAALGLLSFLTFYGLSGGIGL